MLKKIDLPPVWLGLHIVAAWFVGSLFPWPNLANRYVDIVSALMVGLGVGIVLYASYAFYKHKTTIHPNHTPKQLIKSGPFRYSRHPIYLGFMFILIALVISTGSLAAFAVVVSYYVVLTRRFIISEETTLRQHFSEYDNYAAKVRRWL